ncbi:MAG: anti-sigma factor RsbA family regulatory protein [Pseudonocardiaceae bacterium]
MGSGVSRIVAANPGGESLTHQALLYGSEQDFLAGIIPAVRAGLECGDLIKIVTTDRNAGWLRAELGAAAARVEFGDSSTSYRHPVRTLASVHRTVQAASRSGRRLRLIGEPLWTLRTPQENLEWARYESLVNAALAWANAFLVCVYDTRVTAPNVIADMVRTHPELVTTGGVVAPSPSYVDPVEFSAEHDRIPLPELPPPALWLRFDGVGQLVALRALVNTYATQAGVPVPDVERFVQAIDEVATNAIEYGGGSGTVRLWTGPQAMLCEISDTGAGLTDPLAGCLPSGRSTARGRGLWLARQLCDLVDVRSGQAGTTVRLHLNLP